MAVILEENGTKPSLEGHEGTSYDEEHGDWTGGREKIMLPFDHEAGAAGVFRRWSSGRAAVRCSDHLKHCESLCWRRATELRLCFSSRRLDQLGRVGSGELYLCLLSEADLFVIRQDAQNCGAILPEFGYHSNGQSGSLDVSTFALQNLGKRPFKPILELFIDPLFTALTCGQRLSETASGFCVSKLIEFIGPNIFKARLDSKQLAILQSSPLINANSMARGSLDTKLVPR